MAKPFHAQLKEPRPPRKAKAQPIAPALVGGNPPSGTPPPFNDLDYWFWSFADMRARGIVSSRYQLGHLQRELGFPKPIKTGGAAQQSAARWRASEVTRWLDERAAARDAAE